MSTSEQSTLCFRYEVNNLIRIGFILDGMVPSMRNCFAGKTFRPLLTGWPSNTSVAEMRFGWIAERVNQQKKSAFLCYELYRPWRSYGAVVFLKSMNSMCRQLAVKLKQQNSKSIFDANVDYFTPAAGRFYYNGMAPTKEQQEQALYMTRICDGVIADSRHIYNTEAVQDNSCTVWIPDNVPDEHIRNHADYALQSGMRLPVLWCGEAIKLFELLSIEKVLRRFRKWIHLYIITNSLDALDQLYEPWRGDLRCLLKDLEAEILSFVSVINTLDSYEHLGGIFISPRFLDNTYNLGHTEWKITLPMAKGRVVLCSGQPSYQDVASKTGGKGIRICMDVAQWESAFEEVLSARFDWKAEQEEACRAVRRHYATSVIAAAHSKFVRTVLEQ